MVGIRIVLSGSCLSTVNMYAFCFDHGQASIDALHFGSKLLLRYGATIRLEKQIRISGVISLQLNQAWLTMRVLCLGS